MPNAECRREDVARHAVNSIQSLISDDSLLVSNEVIKARVNILQENIIKWGTSNVMITNNDPRDFSRLENYFDVIVIDAPCSGSGLFRRDPEAIKEWINVLGLSTTPTATSSQTITGHQWTPDKAGKIRAALRCSRPGQK